MHIPSYTLVICWFDLFSISLQTISQISLPIILWFSSNNGRHWQRLRMGERENGWVSLPSLYTETPSDSGLQLRMILPHIPAPARKYLP